MRGVIGFLIASVVLMGCSTDESRSYLEVRLTDSPGDYEEVNIDVQGVEIHRAEGNQSSGWVSLGVKKGVYNILTLTNGLDTLLASSELPSGRVSQIRLVLGTNNSVKINGDVFPLDAPSSQKSGLKLNVQTQMSPGVSYVITLDFDAARSIVLNGNGGYKLKPVIRAITEATSGAIKGKVMPVEAFPAVFAIDGTDTLATAYSDSLGFFLLRAVPPGTYKVTFDPKAGYTPTQVEDVVVAVGAATDVGQVQIN